MALKNIIGQDRAVEILSGIIRRNRLATSYLFCGEPGIGKKTTAINFVKALNCLVYRKGSSVKSEEGLSGEHFTPHASRLTAIDACDECDSCIKFDAGTHPDFLLISPEERQIRIEEIRMIDDALSFKPFEGKKKAVIIDDADTMNIAASNAFLKTLEEPPEDSIIILISSKPDRLPETIRSRCSRINFGVLSSDACKKVLQGKIAAEDIDLVSRLSMGRPGIALSGDLAEERDRFISLFKDMVNAEKDNWASREEIEKWFEGILTIFRDMAVLKITGDGSRMIHADLNDYIKRLCKFMDLKVIINIYYELSTLKRLLMFNLNKSITWNYTASLLRKEIAVKDA